MAFMAQKSDETYATNSSLLRRVKDSQDEQSWKQFYDVYQNLIFRFALKAGLTQDEAQEVVQETFISAAKHLPSFRYDPKVCSFKTWLLNLSAWRVRDQFRKRQGAASPQPAGSDSVGREDPDRTATIERVPDPAGGELERLWDEEWRTTLLEAALGKAKERVDALQWQIFHLTALKEWSVKEVTQALGVSAGRVYLARHRIAALVKKELKGLESGK